MKNPNSASSSPTATAPPPSGSRAVHQTLTGAANLANLLPSGTVLAFQTLAPSFSNKGECRLPNKYLTAALIFFCSAACFLSSLTDSFVGPGGKVYYGMATRKGIWIFNDDDEVGRGQVELSRFRVRWIDFVHAAAALVVFLAFAICDVKVQRCFFPAEDLNAVVMNVPLAAGVLSTFFFMVFPTTRRGIGYSQIPRTLN